MVKARGCRSFWWGVGFVLWVLGFVFFVLVSLCRLSVYLGFFIMLFDYLSKKKKKKK